MKHIFSSDYVRYNANSSGRNSGDCVKRAISFAFNKDYNDISKMLLEEMHLQHRSSYKIRPVYSVVIDLLGGEPFDKATPAAMGYPLLKDFIDNYASKGTWLIETSSHPGKESNHIVCVYDSTIYDSWNSSDQYVYGFFKCDNAPVKEITDIKDHAQELCDYIDSTCRTLLDKLIFSDRYSFWNEYVYSSIAKISLTGYTFNCKIKLIVRGCPYRSTDDSGVYVFTVPFVLSPTMTVDSAKEYIDKTAKVRIYDRLYSINQKETAEKEAWETANEINPEGKVASMGYLTPQEERFVNTLPGWCLKLLQFVSIDRPNRYPDSVMVRMTKLPWDNYTKKDTIIFEGWNSSQVRDMINRYHDKHEIAGRDYEVSEDY